MVSIDTVESRRAISQANSPEALKKRIAEGKLDWASPLLFLPARSMLLIAGQAAFALGYILRGNSSPWSRAGAWWTVWGTLADIGCLIILMALTRRENVHLREMVEPLSRQVLFKGVGFFFLVVPFSAGGTFLASWMFYGSWQAPMPVGEVYARHLPLWAVLYSLIVWAPIWSAIEEYTYNGYLVPRIAVLSNRRWVSVVLVGLWWAAQHSFLPLVLDWRFALWRFAAFLPGVMALMGLYIRTQRLAPIIVAHWIINLIAAATTLAF